MSLSLKGNFLGQPGESRLRYQNCLLISETGNRDLEPSTASVVCVVETSYSADHQTSQMGFQAIGQTALGVG